MTEPHTIAGFLATPEHREAVAAPKPVRTFRRYCPECGGEFRTPTRDRQFCTDQHKAAFHNRSSKIGRSVVPLAMAWRAGRNIRGNTPEAKAKRASAKRAFSELCRALDMEISRANASGSVPSIDYLRRRWAFEGSLTSAERADTYQPKGATK